MIMLASNARGHRPGARAEASVARRVWKATAARLVDARQASRYDGRVTEPSRSGSASAVRCAARLELIALPGIPIVAPGDDLVALVEAGLVAAGFALTDGDIVAVTSKIVSRAEGRFVDLARIEPGERARELAELTCKDPRVVELVIRESTHVSRAAPHVLIVRHRLGFVGANASIDASNAAPPGAAAGSGPWALLLPEDPDGSAERLRRELSSRSGAAIGVVVTDSLGRPFRIGTVGCAIGVAGLPPVWDQRGGRDLYGRTLEQTITGLADQVAAAADLVAGQAAEGRPVIVVRGLSFDVGSHAAAELYRAPDQDLFA
jgi:coenzyme F420-0:L-glutamate ligase/coenzyme F420-1:gamma-L-glutamate ligase